MVRPIALILCLGLICFDTAEASPALSAAKRAYQTVRRDQRVFARRVSRLSTGEKQELKNAIVAPAGSDDPSSDPDGDGLDNSAEDALGSNTCGRDSDGDGVDDRDDPYEGDTSGVYGKGVVAAFQEPLLTVGANVFTVTDTTRFKGRGFSASSLEVGLCVEVEGHQDGLATIADKIERKKSSECGGDNGDDNNDD